MADVIAHQYTGIPEQWQATVSEAIQLALQVFGDDVGTPQLETDPEDDLSWVSIPIRARGEVRQILDKYDELVELMVQTLTPQQRQKVAIDLRLQ